MSKYTKPGSWHKLVEGILYTNTKPLTWEVGSKGSNLFVTVPTGTMFDVTVPWVFRWLFDPHDERYLKGAALHDELLRIGWDRATSGAIFHEALKADKVAAWKRLIMWTAVTLFKYR